ncbi:MAG: UDP-N-acetylglucosamine 2-epimerase (non-hydrolyzing) [Bryobacterales bacterium]|nr:UDP-N-acetylglucosamine 2-epimerase (non-hydrolyzing) [Bryobacteraceae bacterium]MDW8131046.1 UDP-N-acetylglucosamine 2-epimerase (non-hydrolyzing) [Bryobacterales bacterium]
MVAARPKRILIVLGTRPEAIKLCPVQLELSRRREFDVRVCATAQHRDLLDQALEVFGVRPDWDLDLMRPDQTLAETTARVVAGLEPVLREWRPDMVLVQGDTTTTFCAALAAFYHRIPVGHVEAGLRTWDPAQPFPEEINRVLTSRLASLHFAATPWAAGNLMQEGVPAGQIVITGNPGIDAVLWVRDRLEAGLLAGCEWSGLDPSRRWIVVTAHRRESFGEGFRRICSALAELASRADLQIIYPVHPNPNVRAVVFERLRGLSNVLLTEPLQYVPFVDLLRRAWLILTDSGGLQEEAPSLGKPVLVLREKTERPEAVEAGTVKLVGTDPRRIVQETLRLLEDAAEYERMSRVHNPYGDGRASVRIADAIHSFFSDN